MEGRLFTVESTTRFVPKGTRKGTRPSYVWIDNAIQDYHCEGLNPFSARTNRRYARGCNRVVRRGDKYLRKAWITFDGMDVNSRHCEYCAPQVRETSSQIRERTE